MNITLINTKATENTEQLCFIKLINFVMIPMHSYIFSLTQPVATMLTIAEINKNK